MKKFGITVLSVAIAATLCGCGNLSIGVIGGADGPTSIIVASGTDRLSDAILEYNTGSFLDGECAAEGHIVLGSESSSSGEVFYLITTYGEYGFENNRFVKVSGTGAIPAAITLAADGTVVDYRTPDDGSGYLPSLKKIFPRKYLGMVTDSDSYLNECINQEEATAAEYLKSIGREAAIGYHHEEYDRLYPLADMNVEASNTLIADKSLAEYPYWIGTKERIENGVRYVYEKQWESRGNGDGIVTYKKYDYATGGIAELFKYEVVGDKLTKKTDD